MATGPTGPTGSLEPSFLFVWSSDEQSLDPASAPGEQGTAVAFTDVVTGGSGLSFTGLDGIDILESGYYNITWNVFKRGYDSAFALFLDAAMVPGSNYGALAHDEKFQGQAIAPLAAGGVLTLNRIDTLSTQTLSTQISGGTPVTGASIVMMKIG